MPARRRPRVICHMMSSLDGRIVTDGWPISPEGRRQYELVHADYAPDGWLCGRVTMAQHFAAADRLMHESLKCEDFKEGVAHFVEKRAPRFSGR